MSIQKRKTGRVTKWVVRWEEEGRHRQVTLDTRAQAIAFDAEKKAELRRRRALGAFAPTEASPMLLKEHVERAWHQRGVAWADTTKETWADILDSWILPLIGDVPLRDLNRGRVRDFRASMMTTGVRAGRRQRVATANRANAVMTVLSAFCGFAVEDGLIPENPCRDVNRLPHKASKHRAHPPLVLERIRAQMTERDALMVSLMYLAGLRPEEALALQWRHVGEKVLVVEQAATKGKIKGTKTGPGAHVELVEPLLEDLAVYRSPRNPGDDDQVIEGRQGEGILRLRPWRQNVWHVARRAAEVGPATPYDCRHTFGSLLIHEGRDILEVQRAMRHASARTTLEHYAHEFAEWKGREKVSLVEAVRSARADVAAEREAAGGDEPPTVPHRPRRSAGAAAAPDHAAGPPALPDGHADPSGERAGAGAPAGTPTATGVSVARKLRTPPGDDEADPTGIGFTEGMGVTGLEPVTPSLSSLPNASQGTTTDHESPDASGQDAGDDEPPIAPADGPRLRESCAPPVLHGAGVAPAVEEYSAGIFPDPPGACEDCGAELHQGVEGTWCSPCEVACPDCGEQECHATCPPRAAATAHVRRHRGRPGQRAAGRASNGAAVRRPGRYTGAARRALGEQLRATRHATWMLAGAR